MVADDGSDPSSSSSFEIQVRTTTPEENVIITSSLKTKIRRESEDASELLFQVCSFGTILRQRSDIHPAEWETCLVEFPVWRTARRRNPPKEPFYLSAQNKLRILFISAQVL
jgi:hypothetical protein